MSNIIKKPKKLTPDEELQTLVETLYHNPCLFSELILGIKPDKQQTEVINALYERKYVSVRSGRGCGKTWCAGIIIWHFLCTRAYSQIYITASSGGTIQGAIWPTLAKLHDNMESMYKDQFELQSTMIKHKTHKLNWFAMTRTARQENPEALAGSHAMQMLYVIDEASGVADAMFNSIFGSLTEEDNYLLMLSNPRRLNGFFYESHQYKARNVYAQLHMNAIKSEFVTDKSVNHWRDLYGEDSNQYQIEVLGEFPAKEDESIIPYDLFIDGVKRTLDSKEYEDIPIIWGLDMAAGNDKSVLVKRQGNYVHPDIKRWKYHDTMKVVGKVTEEFNSLDEKDRPVKIYVDAIGIGKGAYDRLKENELPVYPAIANKKAVSNKYIFNQKSEWWKEMQEWVKGNIDLPNDSELIEEVTSMRAVPSSDGRFRTEGKPQFIKRYEHSPDTGDAFAMTFCLKSKKSIGMTT